MAKKEIDIDEMMVPGNWKLKKTDGTYRVVFADEEMDPIEVEFNYDRCASISTMGYTHLTISSYDLRRLADMVDDTEERYNKEFAKERAKASKKKSPTVKSPLKVVRPTRATG